MGVTSNRSILNKADVAISELQDGGGYLLPAQAHKFMLLLIEQSELMGMATVVPMQAPRQQTPKLKFGQRILRAGKEGTRLSDAERARPDFSFMELDARLFKAEVDLSDEVLEDSIERGDLRQTIMDLIAEAIARDMEEVIIRGDKTSADPFLAQLDGLLVQTVSHVVDAGGAVLTKDILLDSLTAMPSQYLRIKKAMAYLCSVNTELSYRNTLAERATVGGDRWIEQDAPVMYSGIPIRSIPLFPENIEPPAGAPDPVAGPALPISRNRTTIILANPKNLQVGIYRKVRIETWRDISAGVLRVVATLRFDARWADEYGTCKIANLST